MMTVWSKLMVEVMERNARAFSRFLQQNSQFVVAVMAVLALAVVGDPAFAQSGSGASSQLASKGTDALGFIQVAAYFILVVAVIGSGIAAAFGRMEWATVGRVLIGAIVVGLAVTVVQGLSGLSSSGASGT